MRRANPIPDHVIFRKYENNKPNPKIEKYDTSENENTVCEGTKNRGKIFSSNCIIDEIVGRDFEKEAKHEACKNVGYEGQNCEDQAVPFDGGVVPWIVGHSLIEYMKYILCCCEGTKESFSTNPEQNYFFFCFSCKPLSDNAGDMLIGFGG